MAMRVQKRDRSGWYYRVLEEGIVAPGDELRLIDRRSPDWPISRLWRALYVDAHNRDELAAMAALAHLLEGWRRFATRRLETQTIDAGPAP